MDESPNQIRLKAWIYEGVETELAMIEIKFDLEFDRDENDMSYNRSRQLKLQKKMDYINTRIMQLENK